MNVNLRTMCSLIVALSLVVTLFACNQQESQQVTGNQTPSLLEQSGFVGNWKVADGDNIPFYITLNKDGTASSTWGEGESGNWKLIGNKAQIFWTDGWTVVLHKNDRGEYRKEAYAPGREAYGMPTNTSSAEKIFSISSTN